VIERLIVKEYGPIKEASVALTPLHAFVGPNDSGKSFLLRALITAIEGVNTPFWPGKQQNALLQIELQHNSWRTAVFNDAQGPFEARQPARDRRGPSESTSTDNGAVTVWWNLSPQNAAWLNERGRLVRLDPDQLRRSSPLVAEEHALNYIRDRGYGLPGVYDVLINRYDESFAKINEHFVRLFDTAKRFRLLTIVNENLKKLAIDLKSGQTIGAEHMSEGMLYFLALAALPYFKVGFLAIEEPENGLHPARIAEVVGILRDISARGTQVVMATHSPLVLNALKPAEISIVTRSLETGTQVKRLIDTPNFELRSRTYKPGELWVSYANGVDEGPLLDAKKAGEVVKQ
jgi:predicted ATPase